LLVSSNKPDETFADAATILTRRTRYELELLLE
jgi:hypothetical protein